MVPEGIVTRVEDAVAACSIPFTHALHDFTVSPYDVVNGLHTYCVIVEETRYILGVAGAGRFVYHYREWASISRAI